MAVVSTQWGRSGDADGMILEHESRYGIHGGEVETSLMLHFRPDLVRMEHARNFVSKAEEMPAQSRILPPHLLGWIAHDLNPAGVVGDASRGTAEMGAALCCHQVAGFIDLLRDLTTYSLSICISRTEHLERLMN